MNVRPIGIGSASPRTLITNQDLESVHDTSDEWIRTRTGITQRRVLVHDGNRESVVAMRGNGVVVEGETEEEEGEGKAMVPENLRSLGIEASLNALRMSGISPSDIDVVICATSSPDDLFGDAPSIAHAIGCDSRRVVAFDLTAACSGFLFGIVTAGQYLDNGGGGSRNALVIGQDALTRWVDWDDRNSCILFGDGAGAMVLTSSGDDGNDEGRGENQEGEDDGFGILGYAMHSNGGGYDDLKCK
jgi:3-oxoacyl-[acyl-carrier-protein] synthase-3